MPGGARRRSFCSRCVWLVEKLGLLTCTNQNRGVLGKPRPRPPRTSLICLLLEKQRSFGGGCTGTAAIETITPKFADASRAAETTRWPSTRPRTASASASARALRPPPTATREFGSRAPSRHVRWHPPTGRKRGIAGRREARRRRLARSLGRQGRGRLAWAGGRRPRPLGGAPSRRRSARWESRSRAPRVGPRRFGEIHMNIYHMYHEFSIL